MTDVPQEIRDYIDEKFNELEEDQDTKRMIVEVALTDALSLAFGQLIAKGVCSAHELDRIFEQFEDGIRQEHKGDTEEERFIRECGVRILQLLRNRIELAALGKKLWKNSGFRSPPLSTFIAPATVSRRRGAALRRSVRPAILSEGFGGLRLPFAGCVTLAPPCLRMRLFDSAS